MKISEKILDKHSHQPKYNDVPLKNLKPSNAGHECKRKLFFIFNGCFYEQGKIDPSRALMIKDGVRLEREIIQDIEQIHEAQSEFRTPPYKYLSPGQADYFLDVENTIIEIKTMSRNSFNQLKKKGLKEYSVKYYTQIQIYLNELFNQRGEANGTLIALNRDTFELYEEDIPYDEQFAIEAIDTVKNISLSDDIPMRLSEDSKYYICRMCEYKTLCHEEKLPTPGCGSCLNVNRALKKCTLNKVQDFALHGKNCTHHIYNPDFLENQIPIKYENNHMEYDTFINASENNIKENNKLTLTSEQIYELSKEGEAHFNDVCAVNLKLEANQLNSELDF
jgi:CRISPR/Cas system-associated exonuclease Cas4 (RecB family)